MSLKIRSLLKQLKLDNYNMKKWIFSTLIAIVALSCNNNEVAEKIYGEKFEINAPISPDELTQAIDSQATIQDVQLSGTIDESCPHSGCWMVLKNTEDKEIFVTYKDEAFTTSLDIDGRKVTLLGSGSYNEKKDEYEFVASGLILD